MRWLPQVLPQARREGPLITLWLAALGWAQDVDHGKLLAGLGGCHSCHTADDGPDWAGGHALETDYGVFYGSNLTPDAETGLGSWTEADFLRAMQRGRSPDGHAYWPAFPYPSFTGMSDADLVDLWAFLQTLDPVVRPNEPHELSGPTSWRVSRSLWRALFFDAGRFEAPKDATEQWARGAYLVRHVGHCGDCHTPRGTLGQVKSGREFEGSRAPPVPSPPITVGELSWTADDYDSLLSLGMLPDGDFVGGGMTHVIDDGTTHLSDADRAAMIVYLMSVQ